MSKTIILVNGPPGSGKDTFGKVLQEAYGFHLEKFANPIRRGVCTLFGINDSDIEALKPLPMLGGKTLREWMIGYSEDYLKKLGGPYVFGDLCVERLGKTDAQYVCITDSGFLEEATRIVEAYGYENVHMVHLYREGCTFEGDSRNYVWHKDLATYPIVNNGSLEEFRLTVFSFISHLLFSTGRLA